MPARGQPLRAAWPALTVRGVPARGPRKPVSRIAAPHKHFRPRTAPKEARVSSCCVVCLCLCARSTRRAAPAAAGVQGARRLAGSGAGSDEIWTRAEKEWVLVPTRHWLAFVRFDSCCIYIAFGTWAQLQTFRKSFFGVQHPA